MQSPTASPSRTPVLLLALAFGLAGCDRPLVPGDAISAPFVDARADLVVIVQDVDGAPVGDAWLVLDPSGRDASTDAAGEAVFGRVADGTYTVRAVASGFEAAEGVAVVAGGDVSTTLTLEATPDPGATLWGLVTHPDGAPLPDAGIVIDGVDRASSGADGSWEVTGLPEGVLEVVVTPPAGTSLLPWASEGVEVASGARAEVSVTLPGGPPEDAGYLGSAVCSMCHTEQGAAWEQSAHARAARTPAALVSEGALAELAASFVAGETVAVGATGSVHLSGDASGTWWATVSDGEGRSTGPMEVVEVYGGHRTGAALAVDAGGTEAVLPLAWALDGRGLSTEQATAGWIEGWTDGWFDASGDLTVDASGAPGAAASWASGCAGCHAVGHALEEESDGTYTLVPAAGAVKVERAVGCESCHDRGDAHPSTTKRVATIFNPARLPSHQRVEVCARCHERTESDVHPFGRSPAWPVDADGVALGPLSVLEAYATPAPERWLGVEASRVARDQVGDFRVSPHHDGAEGYRGACEDCHDPHGSSWSASLRYEPTDNRLCTSCHGSRFPDEEAEAAHANHDAFHPGTWSPGACVGCHMPRTGVAFRTDAVSGAGELRSHALWFAEPGASLAEFDAAGASTLPYGSAPVPACLDCHLQADAAAEDAGSNCPCPVGDPGKRSTYEHFQSVWETWWGGGR